MSVIIHRYNFFLVLRIFKINFYQLCHTVLLTSHHAHITFRDLVFCNWKFVLFNHLPPIPPTPRLSTTNQISVSLSLIYHFVLLVFLNSIYK